MRIKNNSNCRRVILALFTLVFLLQLTACSNDPIVEESEIPDYVFVSKHTDLMQLYENMHFTGSAVIIGDAIYFSAVELSDFEEKFSTDKLFSADLDGSNQVEVKYVAATDPPPNADAGQKAY